MRDNLGPVKNPDFVLAMKYMLDREMIRKVAMRNFGIIGNDQPVQPSSRFYFAGLPQRVMDLDKAKFHLQKSGMAGMTLPVVAGFTLDRESSRFAYCGTPIELTPREFSMAWLFFSSPGIYISRETIGSSIWSTDSEVAGRTIEQHVYKLRKKLQLGPERGVIIRTAYSQGYRLELLGREKQENADASFDSL